MECWILTSKNSVKLKQYCRIFRRSTVVVTEILLCQSWGGCSSSLSSMLDMPLPSSYMALIGDAWSSTPQLMSWYIPCVLCHAKFAIQWADKPCANLTVHKTTTVTLAHAHWGLNETLLACWLQGTVHSVGHRLLTKYMYLLVNHGPRPWQSTEHAYFDLGMVNKPSDRGGQ